MSVFGKLGAALLETVTLPVAVAADIVTMGGTLTERGRTYTGSQVKRIVQDLEDAADEARD